MSDPVKGRGWVGKNTGTLRDLSQENRTEVTPKGCLTTWIDLPGNMCNVASSLAFQAVSTIMQT